MKVYNVITSIEGEVRESRTYLSKDDANFKALCIVDEWLKNGASVKPYVGYDDSTKEFMANAYGEQYANKDGFYFEGNENFNYEYGSVDIIESEIK